MSINRVNITGNLTRDPELRATAGGTQVLSFGVAVNDRRRNPQTGEWEDYPNFVDCTMFGTREKGPRYLEMAEGYCSKLALNDKDVPAAPAPAARPAAPVATPPAVDVYDEDIPF